MELYKFLLKLIKALEKAGVEYLITGSIASMAYGEPRFTNDADVVVDLKERNLAEVLGNFPPDEYYVSEEAAREAIRIGGQFNIIHPSSGAKIDVIISKENEYDAGRFERARRMRTEADFDAEFSSPEDVIIMKMKYYKEGEAEKHLRDITGMLKASETALERDYIEKWARNFGVLDIWETILRMVKR